MSDAPDHLVDLTAEIVAAYVSRQPVAVAELPALMRTVHDGLAVLNAPGAARTAPTKAEIQASIRPDGLVSFIDGRSYKMLRRHLATQDLTPLAYRERFGLPPDYPMVAPQYSALRSKISKQIQLGVPSPSKVQQAAE